MSKAAQQVADCYGYALIKVDGVSAFNRQRRSVAFQALAATAPATAAVLAQFYSITSVNLVQVGQSVVPLSSNEG